MKQCLVLALVAALAVASIDTDTAYTPGKEYVYMYETISNTALRAATNQIAGLKVKATARLQIDGQRIVTLKLENPELCKVNQEVPSAETVETVMENSCTPLTGPEADVIKQELIKPCSFGWDSGLVSQFRVDAEEAYWSVNIKRGLLNMLQLNLKERNVIENLSPEMRDIVMPNIPYRTGELHQLFRAYEKDLVGECETLYAVMEDDVIPADMHVSKVRNYENCKMKPIFRTGLMASFHDISPSFHQHTPVKALSHADYLLRGNRHEYLVRSATLKTHYSVLPFGDHNVESAYACTSQKLVLLDIVPVQSQIRLSAHMEIRPALRMFIPLEASSHYSELPIHNRQLIRERIDLIHTLLNEAVRMVTPEVSEEVPKRVAEIALILKKLPINDLKEIINTCVSVSATDDIAYWKKELLLDIIPTLTRPDLVEIIKDLVTRNIISTPRAAVMINMMVLTVKPSPKTFDGLMLLLRDPIVSQCRTLKKAVLLSTGVLAHKIKTMFTEMAIDSSIAVPELHKISQELVSLLHSCTTLKEKIEMMGVFGNAGLMELVPEIESIIRNIETPLALKAKAVFALRKVAKLAPRKVQSLLLPLYLKPTVRPSVRIAAFLITMRTEPSAGVTQLIAHGLKKETSMEVISFVYTYLESLSHTPDHRLFNLSTVAKVALREIQPLRPGLVHSKVFNFEKYIRSMGELGADIKMELVNSGYSPIPDNFVTKIAASLMGKKINVAEVGVITKGLKSFMWNLIGPVNRWEDFVAGRASLEDFLLPLSELASKIIGNVDHIRNKFNTRERGEISEKILQVYMKLFDYELATVHLVEAEIIDLIREVKSAIPEIMTALRTGYNARLLKTLSILDAAVVMPTPCGLPVSINASAVAVLGAHGTLRLDGLNSIFELFSASARPVINLHSDIRHSAATSLFFSLGTHLSYFKTAAIVKVDVVHRMPLKSEIVLDLVEKKVKLSVEPPQSDYKFGHVKVTPKTVFEKMLITPSSEGRRVVEEVIIASAPVHQHVSDVYGMAMGMPIMFRTEVAPMCSFRRPETYFLAPIYTEMVFAASRGVPEKWEIEIKYYGPNEASAAVSARTEEQIYSSWWPASSYRTASRDISGLTFDSIIPESGIQTNTKREILAMFRAVGGSIQKEAKIKFAHLCDSAWLKHQFDVQILSSPLITSANSPVKVVLSSVVLIPEFITQFSRRDTAYLERELLSNVQIKYGFTNTVERLASARVFWKRLTDTRDAMNAERSVETMFPFTLTQHVPYKYRNSSALQGIINATLHRKLFHGSRPSGALMLATEIDYDQSKVPALMWWMLPSLHIWALKTPYWLSEKAAVSVMPADNAPNKITLNTIISPLLEEVMMVLQLPTQNNTISGIPLPMPYLFKQYIFTPALPKITTQLMHGDVPSGWCAVTPDNYVHAYDLLSVRLPDNMCEVVLVKDCSTLNLFMVTAKKMAESGKWIVKMYLPSKEIEFIPSAGSWSSIQIKIDGQIITVPQTGSPYIITDPTTGKELLSIIMKDTSVFVSSWMYGLMAETDGTTVSVKASELYRGQVCGVCGDFNSDMYNELRGPQMEMYWTPQPFLHSYMIPAAGCDSIPSYQQHSYLAPASRSCDSLYRNVVIERRLNGEQHICISVEPVAHCSRSCIASALLQHSKPFHCKPAYAAEAQRLREEAQYRPIYLIAEPVHIHDLVSEPQSCRPMY